MRALSLPIAHRPGLGLPATSKVAVRWRTLVHRGRLNREIVAGADPVASPEIARRWAQIVRARQRRALADTLERLLHEAQHPRAVFTSAIPPHRRELRAARPVLEVIVRQLRSGEPVSARGILLLRELLLNGCSPLFVPRLQGELGSRLRDIAMALDPDRPTP